jgi:hypothetical protein
LEKHIKSEKKFNSIYKEGETYSYEYKQWQLHKYLCCFWRKLVP